MEKYVEKDMPLSRLATFDVGVIGNGKHHMAGLVEADITRARKDIRERIRKGEKISLNSWFLKCLGDTIAEDPCVQGMLRRNRKIVAFRDVDISVMIEKEVDGEPVPLVAVIRKTNEKSAGEIQEELEAHKCHRVRGEKDFVLSGGSKRGTGLYYRLPGFLRVKIMEYLMRDPFRRKEMMGTAIVTNVGSAGNISGWIIPKSLHNIAFGIGSINRKPWVVDGEIRIRQVMNLTILFDHNVIDGAPAARFVSRLIGNLESARGLSG